MAPRTHLRTVAALAVLLVVASVAGCSSSPGELTLSDARIEVPANPKVAAAYLTIRNDTGSDEVLESVTSPDAAVTIHRTAQDDAGRSMMTEQAEVKISNGETLSFEPGELHLMLNSLERKLEVGDHVELTFQFKNAGEVVADADVIEAGTALDGVKENDHEH